MWSAMSLAGLRGRSYLVLFLSFFFGNFIFSQNSKSDGNDFLMNYGYGYPTFRQFYGFKHQGYLPNNTGYLFFKGEWKSPNNRASFGFNTFLGTSTYYPGTQTRGRGFGGYGFGFRSCYYFKETDRFHFYGTLGVGFQREEYPYPDLYAEAYVGARVSLSDSWWLFAEAGVGKTLAQAGLTLKLKQDPDVHKKPLKPVPLRDSISTKKLLLLSAGYGIPNYNSARLFLTGNKGSNTYLINDRGSFFVRGELLNRKNIISLGATLFYSHQSYELQSFSHFGTSVRYYDFEDLGIGIRTNLYMFYGTYFHSYLGLGVGGKIPLKDYSYPVYGELLLGFRWMPSKNMGIYLEIGPSKVLAQAGLSYIF